MTVSLCAPLPLANVVRGAHYHACKQCSTPGMGAFAALHASDTRGDGMHTAVRCVTTAGGPPSLAVVGTALCAVRCQLAPLESKATDQ